MLPAYIGFVLHGEDFETGSLKYPVRLKGFDEAHHNRLYKL